jgi:ATP-dependent Clp protease ATP-binding subunit ClpX
MFGRWRTRGCDDPSLRCSFFRKPRNKVKFLVAGPGVYVCNGCDDLCNKVIAKERAPSR